MNYKDEAIKLLLGLILFGLILIVTALVPIGV